MKRIREIEIGASTRDRRLWYTQGSLCRSQSNPNLVPGVPIHRSGAVFRWFFHIARSDTGSEWRIREASRLLFRQCPLRHRRSADARCLRDLPGTHHRREVPAIAAATTHPSTGCIISTGLSVVRDASAKEGRVPPARGGARSAWHGGYSHHRRTMS